MKRILYLTYDGLTDPLGQSQILPYVKGLSKLGYKFTILSCDKPDKYIKLKDTIQALCDEDDIEWISFTFSNKIPILSKIKDRKQFKKLAITLHQKNNYDLIHCRSYISSEIGLYLKQNFKTKFLFDMRGFWADEKKDGGNWNTKKPIFNIIYKFYKQKEKQFLENADYTISLTEVGKKEIYTWKHIKNNPVPIQVIPCCVDLDHFDPNKINNDLKVKFKTQLNITNENFILSYLGSIGTWYMLSEMLDFFIELLKSKSKSKFLFISNENHDLIREEAKKKNINLEHIICINGQRNEVPTLISLSNLSLIFILPTYSKKSSSPTKQAELMAMGIPVISNTGIGDTAEILEKYKSGLIMDEFYVENYINIINKFDKTIFDFEEIRKGAKDYFSLEKGLSLYNEVYKKI